jgi:hypothetical protein
VRERAGSKIAPQVGGAFHQILVALYLLVENERHPFTLSKRRDIWIPDDRISMKSLASVESVVPLSAAKAA